MSGNSTTLTSAAIEDRSSLSPVISQASTFNGTYRINGGCDGGDKGTLTGNNVWNIGNNLSGTFTNSAQKTFNLMGRIAQSDNASSDGSFPITGTATFDTPCSAPEPSNKEHFPPAVSFSVCRWPWKSRPARASSLFSETWTRVETVR